MKIILSLSAFILAGSISFHVSAQTKKIDTSAQLVLQINFKPTVYSLKRGCLKTDMASFYEKMNRFIKTASTSMKTSYITATEASSIAVLTTLTLQQIKG